MELRSKKVINTSFKRPKTPAQDLVLKEPETPERAAYFYHFDHRRNDEKIDDIAAQHRIHPSTGERWRKEREHFRDERRVRKRKAEEEGHKLGRPWRVSNEKIKELLEDDTNPVREDPLRIQRQVNKVPLSTRALQYNLSNREDAHLFVAAYSDEIRPANKKIRVSYGEEHMHQPLFGFWDHVFFTDEAHFNLYEDFQRPRILRRRGERLKRGNLRTRKRVVGKGQLHFYAYVN